MNRRSCIELENNKSLNPLTLRRIDPTKGVFKKLANECLDLGINVRSRRARSCSRERRSPPRMQSRSTREQPRQVMESSKQTSPDRKLARYQRKVVEFMKKPANNAILMVHSLGSRKTFTTINAVFELQKQRPNVHVLIIAPKRNLDEWQSECLRFKIKNVDYISFAYLVNNPNDFFRLCQDGIVVIDEVHNLRTENEHFHYSKTKIVKFLKAKKFSDEMIGQGSFAKVYKGMNIFTSKLSLILDEIVAIKVMEMKHIEDKRLYGLLETEIEILKSSLPEIEKIQMAFCCLMPSSI